jgi:hypothetical protein
MELLASRGTTRIGLEVIDSVSGEHPLVNVEVAAIAPVARIAGKNQRGRVCDYRRRAAMFRTDIWNHLKCGSLDHCSRSKRIIKHLNLIEMYVSSTRHDVPTARENRFHRFSYSGTYRVTHLRIVECAILTPRSAIISTRSRYDNRS